MSISNSLSLKVDKAIPVNIILSGPTQADAEDNVLETTSGKDIFVRPIIIPSTIETVNGLRSFFIKFLPPVSKA